MDFARFEDLHIVRKIREKIRKWWNIELSYADESGYVLDHARGKIVPPHNGICQASLASREGFHRCNLSVERAIDAVRDQKEIRARVIETCHIGFPIVLVPVVDDRGTFHGAIFAGGFLLDDERASRRERVADASTRLHLPIADQEAAYAGVPTITRRDLDYFCDLLETTVEEIVEFNKALRQRESRIQELTGELAGRYTFGNIVGKSPAMARMFAVLEKVVDTDATILVTGENGTGKELIARALHYNGPRRNKPFVVQNVSALNDNLLESELFGHVKGAFTGATRDKQGLFKVADGGTFFLDEVGDMSMAMQVKLLRVLQEGTFLPVGATRPEKVDVRIIAATNRDLKEMVARREFREDLYYRLNVINIRVPPLRDRKEDLPALVEHFLRRQAEKRGLGPKRLSGEVMARFYAYDWPGNIRELENEIERLVVLSGDDEVIGPELLDTAATAYGSGRNLQRFRLKGDLASAVAALEKEMIQEGLVATHWNKTRLAERLGISRTTLIKKIKEYGLEERGNPLEEVGR
ncbi:MAG: sigma-54-dependent Fis family transcriptional regulator [Deltaproteobacteria bacterium]|nr:MAG: sigma-54-dependent Fis family transcriptional regulator [Deltaproteobacteria bacterium]